MERKQLEMEQSTRSYRSRGNQVRVSRLVLKLVLIGSMVAVATVAFIVYSLGDLRPPVRLTDEQEYGRSLYSANCAVCHEVNQLGLKKVPPNLHGVFKLGRLPSGSPASDAEVRRVILGGKNTMPSFNQRLTDAQVSAIISYLHTGIK
jgi:mono/diheme cytochrome c family protein